MKKTFDDIVAGTGEFGRYQKQVYGLVCLLVMYEASVSVLYFYATAKTPHTCTHAGTSLNGSYASSGTYLNTTGFVLTERENETYARNATLGACQYWYNGSREMCREWDYDTSVFTRTATSQFDLVCGDKIWKANIRMMNMIGHALGGAISGPVGDRFGRKKLLVISTAAVIVMRLGMPLSTNVYMLAVFTMLSAACGVSLFSAAFSIGVEFVGVSKRFHTGIIIEYFFCFGLMWTAFVSYFVRDWVHLSLACLLPGLPFVIYWWTLPESPRWLISKRRMSEAKVVIERMARTNRAALDEGFITDLIPETGKTTNLKIWHLFRHPRLVLQSVLIGFNWILVTLTYYGLTFNIGDFSSDMHLNMFLSALVELCGYFLCHVTVNRIGRKRLFIGCMITAGVVCVSTILPRIYLSESSAWATIALALAGKLLVSSAFGCVYIYTVELVPTAVRATGLTLASMVGRVGSVISPYIADISELVEDDDNLSLALPLMIFGAASATSGVLTCLLPETLGRKLPETIEDVLNLYRRSEDIKRPGVPECDPLNPLILDTPI